MSIKGNYSDDLWDITAKMYPSGHFQPYSFRNDVPPSALSEYPSREMPRGNSVPKSHMMQPYVMTDFRISNPMFINSGGCLLCCIALTHQKLQHVRRNRALLVIFKVSAERPHVYGAKEEKKSCVSSLPRHSDCPMRCPVDVHVVRRRNLPQFEKRSLNATQPTP